jgi:Lysozyme like domain
MPNAAPAGTNLSYAQLKAVWLDASKGTRYHSNTWASLMAAIAEAESGGDPLATNPNDNNGRQTSWGLWQISNGTHAAPGPGWADPTGNARLAIGKLNSQGLSAWGTYDSGAYKRYLSDKTAADYTLTNAPSAVTQSEATSSAEAQKSCAWEVGWGGVPLFGFFGPKVAAGSVCLLSKSQLRGMAGVALLAVGGLVTMTGVNWIVFAAAGPKILGVAGAVIAPEAAAPTRALGARLRASRSRAPAPRS